MASKNILIFVLCFAILPAAGFTADAPKNSSKNSAAASGAANSPVTGPKSTLQQLLEKQSAAKSLSAPSAVPQVPAPAAAPSAPAVDPAFQAYQSAPETVPAAFGGTTPEGGNKWVCPRGYRVNGTTRIPFSESNLICQKDPFLFDLNQAGSCVHNPNSGNPTAGCVTSIGPAPSSIPMPPPAPLPPAPAVDPAFQAYQNAPETVPVISGGTLPDGSRKWTCPRGFRVINTAALPFSESNLQCKKDHLFFDQHICGNCVYNPAHANPVAGCVSGQESC